MAWLAAVAAVPFPQTHTSLQGGEQAVRELKMNIARAAGQIESQANRTLLRRSKITCNPSPSKVAVLISMDIRLPADDADNENCNTPGDAFCASRSAQVKALASITKGSDVFVSTDQAFSEDVEELEHVVATRFSEEVGGFPGLQERSEQKWTQWWRFMHAWKLLEDYEQQCSHKYAFAFKLRTDAIVIGGGTIAELLQRTNRTINRTRLLTFTDRWFGGQRQLMKKMASLYASYDEDERRFHGQYGTCGGCQLLATAVHDAQTSPHVTELPLPDNVHPNCSWCFKSTGYGSQFCPLRAAEKNRLWELAGGDAAYLAHKDESKEMGADPWPQPPPKGSKVCIFNTMKHKEPNAAPAENNLVVHILRTGIRPLRWGDDADRLNVLSTRQMGLMSWRHMMHLWTDGFTINDGPLQPAKDPKNAEIMARLELGLGLPTMKMHEEDDFDGKAAPPHVNRHNRPFRRSLM